MHLIRHADETGIEFARRMFRAGLETNTPVTGECPFSKRTYVWEPGQTHLDALASGGRYD
jgi:hypothetical protein